MPDSRATRLALVALQVAAAWACATAFRSPALLALALLGGLSLRLELPPLPAALARLLARLVLGLASLIAALGLAWVLYLPVADAVAPRLPPVAGPTLAGLGGLLLLARRSVPAARGALPASLGALLSASFVSTVHLELPIGLAGLAGFALLAAGAPPRRRLLRLLAVGVPAVAIVLGLWRLLPWAQPFVEAAVADVTNPTSSGLTGFGGPSRLGDVQALSRSTRPLLRLYAPRPVRLRAQVLTRFDGRIWNPPQGAGRALAPLTLPRASAALREWQDGLPGQLRGFPGVLPEALHAPDLLAGSVVPIVPGPFLFVPFGLAALKAGAPATSAGIGGTLVGREAPSLYGFLARPEAAIEEPCGDECLSLPERLDPRWRALADALGRGAAPAERVARTLQHLDECCRYTLEPGAFRTAEPLTEFLFEKRRGYCEYFASSAALLLRLQGLPTRYVKGLQVGEDQRVGEHFLVRESAAHAWIDVRLAEGWREVDPTPADDYAAEHAQDRPGWLARVWERLAALTASGRARLSSLDLTLLLALARAHGWELALLVAAGLSLRAWRRRGRRPPTAVPLPLRPELRALVRRFDERCARAGVPRPTSRGLLEHLERLPAAYRGADWVAPARELAVAIYAEVYGGRVVSSERLHDRSSQLG